MIYSISSTIVSLEHLFTYQTVQLMEYIQGYCIVSRIISNWDRSVRQSCSVFNGNSADTNCEEVSMLFEVDLDG